MSVNDYILKVTQLSRYAPKIVADLRSRMSLFTFGTSCLSRNEGKVTKLIGDVNIESLMIHVQKVEEDKFRNKRDTTTGNESSQQNTMNVSRSSFQYRPTRPAP